MFLLNFIFFILLIVIAFSDAKTRTISNRWNAAILLLGLIGFSLNSGVTITSRLIGLFVISLPMLVTAMIIPGGIGGGDIKLMAAAGFYMGWEKCVMAAFLGFFLGGIYSIYLLTIKKAGRKSTFPLGPFLCIGIMISLFGDQKCFILP